MMRVNTNHPISLRHARGAGRRGAVLILVLWIVLVLSYMAYSLAYEIRLGVKTTSQGRRKTQADALARQGVAKAVMDLKNDRLISLADNRMNFDSLADIWALTEDKTEMESGDETGTWTVRVIDEERKLDLNRFDRRTFLALAYLLQKSDEEIDEEEAEAIAEAIIDYMDEDMICLLHPDQNEIDYYTEWGWDNYGDFLPDDWIFQPRNAAFMSVDELLAIPGITYEMLYGFPDVTPSDPMMRADWEEPLVALNETLTVISNGRVNINTCSQTVIEAMLSATAFREGDVEDIAETILDAREERLDDDDGYVGYMNPMEMAQEGKVPSNVVSQLINFFQIGSVSTHFRVLSRGEVGRVRSTLDMIVAVEIETYKYDPEDFETLGRRDEAVAGYLKSRPNLKIDPAVRVVRGAAI